MTDPNPYASPRRVGESGRGERAKVGLRSLGKYLARCPACGARLSRRHYFTFGADRCPACKARIKPEPIWEWITSAPGSMGIVLAVFLAMLGVLHWVIVAGVALAVVVVGWIVFPYVTPYILLGENHPFDREPTTPGEDHPNG